MSGHKNKNGLLRIGTAKNHRHKAPGKKPEIDIIEGLKRFIDDRIIEAAIPPNLRKRGVALKSSVRLGGLTNRNYKLQVGGESIVLRLPGRGTGRFIDRSTERANQDAAARGGFTAHSIYFDGRTGVKITPFLHEARAFDCESAQKEDSVEAIASLLSRFHHSGIRFVNDFDVFKLTRIYERVARGRFGKFYEGFDAAKKRIAAFEHPLSVLGSERVACHNDLVPENILRTPSGLTLIDWEYSGMNDPAWDLASVILESGLDAEAEHRFLACYTGSSVSERLRLRVDAYKLMQDFLWSLWSILQETASRNPAKARGIREYGANRFLRALEMLPHVEARFDISKTEE